MLYGRFAFDYHRPEINDILKKGVLGLITTRQTKEAFSVLITNIAVGQHKLSTPYDGSYVFPLMLPDYRENNFSSPFSMFIQNSTFKKASEKEILVTSMQSFTVQLTAPNIQSF